MLSSGTTVFTLLKKVLIVVLKRVHRSPKNSSILNVKYTAFSFDDLTYCLLQKLIMILILISDSACFLKSYVGLNKDIDKLAKTLVYIERVNKRKEQFPQILVVE